MRKIGLLCLALVLALGTMGVGYALWSEDLYINGTINTGDVDVEWSLHSWGSDETKQVSVIDAWFSGDTLYVTIDKAYPCVTYWVLFDIHCVGSIPVHFTDFVINRGNLPAGASLSIRPDGEFASLTEYFAAMITQTQLHNCEEWWGVLELHLDNDAVENTTYTFSASVMAYQYNETP